MNNEQQVKPNGTGIGRILNALKCSMLGFKAAYKHESAFRQEIVLCLVLFPFSFVITSSILEWALLMCSLLFLLFAEIINSAIEALADRISSDHNDLIGRAKDLGSAGVLIAVMVVFIMWAAAFYSRFIH